MAGREDEIGTQDAGKHSVTTDDKQSGLNLSDEKKADVAVAQLAERYTALHNMRDRSMQFAVWILGFGFAMAWLLISDVALSPLQARMTFGFVVVIGVASFLFVRGIHIGFKNNRTIVVRLEESLRLFEKGTYHKSKAVLNGDFNCTKFKPTEHFFTLYCLMAAVYIFLVVLVVINPCSTAKTQGSAGAAAEQTNASSIQGETK